MSIGKVKAIRKADGYPGYSIIEVEHPKPPEKKKKKGESSPGMSIDAYGTRCSDVMVPANEARDLTIGDDVRPRLERMKAARRSSLVSAMKEHMAAEEEEVS